VNHKLVYFGHPRLYYNTDLETNSIMMIHNRFPDYIILNPNQRRRFNRTVNRSGFNIFYSLVGRCDVGVFMLMSDGRWGAGIYREAQRMEEQNKLIYEVNPLENTIKITTTSGIIPMGMDDPYYKMFEYGL